MNGRMKRALVLLLALAVPALADGPHSLKRFDPSRDRPLTRTGVAAALGGWRIKAGGPGPVRLFEVAGPACEGCRLLYRAKVKAKGLAAPAFLEMWVRLPDKGQFFSRGLDQTVAGTVDWTSVEIPFILEMGQRPDLVKLNVSFQGPGGALWIKDVELLAAPRP
jgi:hypothetical protein